MGAASIQSLLLSLDLKDMVLSNKGGFMNSSDGSLWSKMRRRRTQREMPRRRTLIMMKRRRRMAFLEGSRRQVNGVEGKVRTLKKLVPNGNSMDFDGLLMETAHYILSLEMQVKLMKIMVSVLSDGGSNEN